jgi:hypothetical protein
LRHLARRPWRAAITELGVAPERIDTVIDMAAVERFGVKFVGSQEAANTGVPGQPIALIAADELVVPRSPKPLR